LATFDQNMQRINRRIGQLVSQGERQVARQYASVLLEIRAILSTQFESFEQDGKLTLEEMLKHSRLTKMMDEINYLLRTHYRDIAGMMERILGETYLDGYYMTAWAIESEVKTQLAYTAIRPESLTAMLANPVAGLTLNARLEMQRARIIYEIQQQVTQGLRKNETYSTMAKRLKKELEGDAVKAMRIVRTEGHRVQESAKHDAADHANNNGVVMMKQWNTQEDERVRNKKKGDKADHKKLNNKKVAMDGTFNDGLSEGKAPGQLGAAASDINCRCFLTYSVEKVAKTDKAAVEAIAFDRWKKERLQV